MRLAYQSGSNNDKLFRNQSLLDEHYGKYGQEIADVLGDSNYWKVGINMHIEEINWLDIGEEEAVLKVVSDADCLICFSCPCSYNVGDVLVEPLECLDTENIILCERTENIIEKMEGEFKYKLRGELKNMEKGIVEVKGFALHIDEDKIPKDVSNGMCIQFEVSRIDIW